MSEAEQTQGNAGRLLAGRYRLGAVLGRGGMGTVWRADDETLGRVVAVKELRFPANIDEDEKRRLITRTLREAKAIARIRSAGAVTVYDVVHEDDRPWIVMELIEGRSLADVIREDGPLQWRRAAEVGLAVLDVLRAAHRQGILHRDVKPSNVLIADDGRVVLTDFGIAQVEGDPSVTSTGMLVGAPSYISPERARGHKPGPPADLWSLGGLLYAAVEGAPPYDKGSAIATLTAVMTEPLGPPRNAGPLEEVIYGLLAKDPQKRLDEAGARALLSDAVSAPDERRPAAPVSPDLEATQAIAIPSIPPASAEPAFRPGAAGRKSDGGRAARMSETTERTPAPARTGGSTKPSAKASAAGEEVTRETPGKPAAASPKPAARPPVKPAGARPSGPASATGGARGAFKPLRDDTEGSSSFGARAEGADQPVKLRVGSVAASARNGRGLRGGTTYGRASIADVVPRRVLIAAAVVVVLAVVATVLTLALSGGDGGDEGKKGGSPRTSNKGMSVTLTTVRGDSDRFPASRS
ncbi:hypothetical protein GCM10010218_44070 [Streptomyces mashuensis]|uniref:non-specific serine/threonine protein kinase n=1 Tax=Streptomyces mashuensis TaxID=33904 RepID=A0A919B5N6_9ACTN|nr:hypothetical protein GCM10010218_44070 [Streptomyces mashuensis]